ncbi:MAG TPA: hypothetical protein VFN67_09020, partial [Polyangiales bacterium]|nr:hypothetical protein [Polyangiales bacterium]
MAVSSKPRSHALINATYELQDLLSSHEVFDEYRARDLRDDRTVLVKRLHPELALQPEQLARFVARSRVLERLDHPCLPRVHVDTDESGVAFVVQELCEGRPLADLIGAFPQGVPLPLLASVVVPLVEALALAHAAGLSHGALDPTQVLLVGPLHDPTAKLLRLDDPPETLRQDPSYRAPDATTTTVAADVFACGVMLYHMLSGVLPFQSGKRSAVPLHELAPHVPSSFAQLTAACLGEHPEQRPAHAGALLKRLRVCCGLAPRNGAAEADSTRPDTHVPGMPDRARSSVPAQRSGHPRSAAPAAQSARAARARSKTDDTRGTLSAQQAAELLSAKLNARHNAGSDPAANPRAYASALPPKRASQPTAAQANATSTGAHSTARSSKPAAANARAAPTATQAYAHPSQPTAAQARARSSQPTAAS